MDASNFDNGGIEGCVNIFTPVNNDALNDDVSTNEKKTNDELYTNGDTLRRRKPNPLKSDDVTYATYLSAAKNFYTNTIRQQNVPEICREEISYRFLRVLRNKKVLFYITIIALFIILFFFFIAYSGTKHAIASVDSVTIEDMHIRLGHNLIHAEANDYAYRKGSIPMECNHFLSNTIPESDVPLHIVMGKMTAALIELNTTCLCAPLVGYQLELMLFNDTGDMVWLANPQILPLPFFTWASEVIYKETSSLFPHKPAVEVMRHSKIRVHAVSNTCQWVSDYVYDEAAACIQGCVQLLEGKTVFDLQHK